MIRFLRGLLAKEKTKPIAPRVMADNSEPEDLMTKKKRLATVDMDGIAPENRPSIDEELVKLSGFSLFERGGRARLLQGGSGRHGKLSALP